MQINTHQITLAAAFFLFLASACTTTQSPETQFDDASITTNIKTELASEELQTLTNIEVNTTNGIVTLAGQVQSEEDKRRAEEVARSVEGVQDVYNNLQVAEPAPPPEPETAP